MFNREIQDRLRIVRFLLVVFSFTCLQEVSFTWAKSGGAFKCKQSERSVQIAKNNYYKTKSFLCVDGKNGGSRIKVERMRLSETAASIFSNNNGVPPFLKGFGNIRLLRNSIYRRYAMLVKKYGTVEEIGKRVPVDLNWAQNNSFNGYNQTDRTLGTKVDVSSLDLVSDNFPAINEIQAMIRGEVSNNAYYAITKKRNQLIVWRYLTSEDERKHEAWTDEESKILGVSDANSEGPEKYEKPPIFSFLADISGDGVWPEKLLPMIVGRNHALDMLQGATLLAPDEPMGCESSDYTYLNPKGQYTSYYATYVAPSVYVDGLVISNVGSTVEQFSGIVGAKQSVETIRSYDPNQLGKVNKVEFDDTYALKGGESIFLPTAIVLKATPLEEKFFDDTYLPWDRARNLVARLGFRAAAENYRDPNRDQQDGEYTFGENFKVGGIILGSDRVVDLPLADTPPSNLDFTFTIASGRGSCPYLVVERQNDDRRIDVGKILHKSSGFDLEDSEIISFEGLPTNFQIEEREPELARLNFASLKIWFQDGHFINAVADNPRLRKRDNSYVVIGHNESLTLTFNLPARSTLEQVARSELTVSGYYVRYSNISKSFVAALSGRNNSMLQENPKLLINSYPLSRSYARNSIPAACFVARRSRSVQIDAK